MKLSTKGRYAARAMLELALHYKKGLVLLREISDRQAISSRYLERIMASLVSSGLASSSRGKSGGFRLAKSPEEITLNEVIQVVEGSIAPVACVDDPESCNRIDICVTRDIWKKMNDAMNDILNSTTLADMIVMQKKKLSKHADSMYYI